MIVDLPDATTQEITTRLVQLRNEVGAMAMGRVMTLVIDADEHTAESAREAATSATRQHPSRIVLLERSRRQAGDRIDAQILLGGDAGASEVVRLRLHGELVEHAHQVLVPLLLPDSPVVAWWPGQAPRDVARTPLGRMAQRRITDAAAADSPREDLSARAQEYRAGDTDLGWTRITRWRALLAAALDQPPYEPVRSVTVTGGSDSPATDLLTAWLADRLRCPATRARTRPGASIVSVRLDRASGPVDLVRVNPDVGLLTQPGQPARRVSMPETTAAEALAAELRRLDPDSVFARALRVAAAHEVTETTASEAVQRGLAPDVEAARAVARQAGRETHDKSSDRMEQTGTPPDDASSEQVRSAAAGRLADLEAGADESTDSPRRHDDHA